MRKKRDFRPHNTRLRAEVNVTPRGGGDSVALTKVHIQEDTWLIQPGAWPLSAEASEKEDGQRLEGRAGCLSLVPSPQRFGGSEASP